MRVWYNENGWQTNFLDLLHFCEILWWIMRYRNYQDEGFDSSPSILWKPAILREFSSPLNWALHVKWKEYQTSDWPPSLLIIEINRCMCFIIGYKVVCVTLQWSRRISYAKWKAYDSLLILSLILPILPLLLLLFFVSRKSRVTKCSLKGTALVVLSYVIFSSTVVKSVTPRWGHLVTCDDHPLVLPKSFWRLAGTMKEDTFSFDNFS